MKRLLIGMAVVALAAPITADARQELLPRSAEVHLFDGALATGMTVSFALPESDRLKLVDYGPGDCKRRRVGWNCPVYLTTRFENCRVVLRVTRRWWEQAYTTCPLGWMEPEPIPVDYELKAVTNWDVASTAEP